MINHPQLYLYRMDWYAGKFLTADQFSQALATAAKYFAVKYGRSPSRAWIHESQATGQLALMAQDLSIVLIKVGQAYNINHILLSIGDDKHDQE